MLPFPEGQTGDAWGYFNISSDVSEMGSNKKGKCCYFFMVAQWLRCCATNRKVAGSIPAGVIGFFIDIKSFRSHYGPGVDSATNRNEYQEHFLE